MVSRKWLIVTVPILAVRPLEIPRVRKGSAFFVATRKVIELSDGYVHSPSGKAAASFETLNRTPRPTAAHRRKPYVKDICIREAVMNRC